MWRRKQVRSHECRRPINGTDEKMELKMWCLLAYLYKDFNVQADFDAAEKYAKDLDVLLWSNSKQRKMVIAQE